MECDQVGVLVLFLFVFLSFTVPWFEQQLTGLQINSSFRKQCLFTCCLSIFHAAPLHPCASLLATQAALQISFLSPYFFLTEDRFCFMLLHLTLFMAYDFTYISAWVFVFLLRSCLVPWIINTHLDMNTSSWMASYGFESLCLMYGSRKWIIKNA